MHRAFVPAAGVPVVYLGLVQLPVVVAKDPALRDVLKQVHITLDWILLIELSAIIIYCILSYIPSARYDSNFRLLAQFVEPVVRPFRRLIPPLGGMDFSCWFASIALILVRMLVIAPLTDLSQRL